MRTRVLSDLHIGHSASRLIDPAMLRPLLEGVDRLVLAGDIWQERKAGFGRARAKELFEKLLALVAERGIEVVLLRGNHDPGSGNGVAWLADRKILVTHGDAVYDDATPWSREIGRYRAEVDAIVAKYSCRQHLAAACADRAKEIALAIKVVPLPKLPPPFNFFATALWPPSRPFEMIRVWLGMGKQGLSFLERSGEGASVLICGHFHQAGIWEGAGRLMINTGSFMKGSRAWCVDLDEASLSARRLELLEGGFVLGAIQGSWRLD
ncbi:metallophosphoesterase [Verrucomicrobiaceae bacterium 227]